jgi:hypothetical protein
MPADSTDDAGNSIPLGGEVMYLTDEVFLFRLVHGLEGADDEGVDLEDCYGLDVVRVPLREMRRRRLRLVTPRDPSMGT